MITAKARVNVLDRPILWTGINHNMSLFIWSMKVEILLSEVMILITFFDSHSVLKFPIRAHKLLLLAIGLNLIGGFILVFVYSLSLWLWITSMVLLVKELAPILVGILSELVAVWT